MLVQIGCRDQKAARLNLFDEDQQAVDHTAELAVFAGFLARAGNRIELIEEQHTGLTAGELKRLPDIGRGLAELGGNQAVEPDMKKGKPELIGENLRAQSLARPRRSAEQQLGSHRKPVTSDPVCLSEFPDQSEKELSVLRREQDIMRTTCRFHALDEIIRLVRKRNQARKPASGPRSRTDTVQCLAQAARQHAVILLLLLGDYLLDNRAELFLVAVARKHFFDQFTACHTRPVF